MSDLRRPASRIALALTIALLAAWGAARAQDKKDEDKDKDTAALIKKLGHDKAEERAKAYKKLAAEGAAIKAELLTAYWGKEKELGQTIADMIQALGSDDWNVRRRATLVLADTGLAALPRLREARDSEDAEVAYRARILIDRIKAEKQEQIRTRNLIRASITQILGELGGAEAMPILADALTHGDLKTRRVAARSLARLELPAEQLLPVLTAALKDEDLWVAAYAAHGLGKLGDAAALPPLLAAARPPEPAKKKLPKKKPDPKKATKKDPKADPTSVVKLIHGLPAGSMPPLSSQSGGLRRSSLAFRRSRALRALEDYAREGDEAAVSALIAGLADPQWIVRIEATQSLERVVRHAGLPALKPRYKAQIKDARKLSEALTKRLPELIAALEPKRGQPEAEDVFAAVASVDSEAMNAFTDELCQPDGELKAASAIAALVNTRPLIAHRVQVVAEELIADPARRKLIQEALKRPLTRHLVSVRHQKDRKTLLVDIEGDGSLIALGEEGPTRIHPDQLVAIQFDPGDAVEGDEPMPEPAPAEDNRKVDQVLLTSGEKLTGDLEKLKDGIATLRWTTGRTLSVPEELIAAISLSRKLSSGFGSFAGADGEITTRNGSRLVGKVLAVDGQEVVFDMNGLPLTLTRKETVEIRFPRSPSSGSGPKLEGHFARARLLDGDRLWGTLLRYEAGSLVLGSETLGLVSVPVERILDLQLSKSLGFESDTTVVANNQGNSIVFFDLKGKVVRKIDNIPTPVDVERLQHGHLLVTLNREGAVIELDENGEEIWRVTGFSQPSDADRLPNGHTLVTDRGRGRIIELDYERNVVFQFSGIYCSDVERLPNGHTILADNSRGRVVEIDPFGNVAWELSGYRNLQDVDVLPNGNLLLTERINRVIEIDRSGREVWSKTGLRMPVDADRLANGNTLITEASASRVIEVDPSGKIVRQFTGLSTPMEANRR